MSRAARCIGTRKEPQTTNHGAKIVSIHHLSKLAIALAFALSDTAMYGFMEL